MTTSFTGKIETNGEYETVSSLSGVTFTSGKSYSIQIQNLAYLKIADAEFAIYTDEPFTYTASSDDLYIKTDYASCVLTILENA